MLSRRRFVGRVLAASAGGVGAALGLSACPLPKATTPSSVVVLSKKSSEILAQISQTKEPYFSPLQGPAQPTAPKRFYLVAYDTRSPEAKRYVDAGVAAAGLMALSERCPAEGCRVSFCAQSQWFECPCHGDKFNRAGEYKLGPATRGMDRLKMTVRGDVVTVYTSEIVEGPPRGVNTTKQEKEGPFCV